jgi:hypothetical protein
MADKHLFRDRPAEMAVSEPMRGALEAAALEQSIAVSVVG